jgi:hypothetical protein
MRRFGKTDSSIIPITVSKQPSAKPSSLGLPLDSAIAISIMPQIRLTTIKTKKDQMFILHLCWTFMGGCFFYFNSSKNRTQMNTPPAERVVSGCPQDAGILEGLFI